MSQRTIPSNCKNCEHISTCFMNFVDSQVDVSSMPTRKVKYMRRQTLCKEGEFSSSIKLILSGFVMILVEGPNKKNIITKIVKPGDFLGVSAICGEDTYSFSAIALSDTSVCSIERDAVVNLLMKDGDFALKLAKWYCSNNSSLFKKMKTIGFNNLHGRMADAILYLNSDAYINGEIYKYLTRKDIADLAGMPMESAVRILSEFNDDKIIKIKGKEIEILNFELLNKIKLNG